MTKLKLQAIESGASIHSHTHSHSNELSQSISTNTNSIVIHDHNNSNTPKLSTNKLPKPPAKRKTKNSQLMRQYLLNATQVRKLNDTELMQDILLQVGTMASFFVQPGNKLFVHLQGKPSNDKINSIWQNVEQLLIDHIGDLNLLQQTTK